MTFVRSAFLLIALVAVFLCLTADAGVVCGTRDCSDILGDFLVKDNRLSSKILTQRQHLDYAEQSRVHRIDVLRRERASL
ncbi:membrane-associated protein, putative [Bodo saltans]|uniref:Membrane-associated protein, putative n=1 Tax=Bodo saltans TaxID=75058 RepID=A0A0S4JTJ9_BODSA|nr:membrane-associated protein, putative [Bodo saltans]|eukprot:CUG92745.1 membrane-associated protein, putative [Bodo saltans]